MKYFLAVVPPTQLANQIDLFRSEWSQVTLPAHITVKAPNSLAGTEQWLSEVKTFCEVTAPITVILDGVGQFASTVVYLRVISPALVALHHSLLEIINPPLAERAAYFEGPAYEPHLTLAHINEGLDAALLDIVRQRATEKWAHAIEFVAKGLQVFRTSGSNQAYELYQDLPLAGKKSTAG
jgi:2'-5' RNA ligase